MKFREIFLLKNGEIALKGMNKATFEAQLIRIIKNRIKNFGEFEVKKAQSTIIVSPLNDDCDYDRTEEAISKIFGIAGYSRCAVLPKNMDIINKDGVEYLLPYLENVKTFKVESKRSDKRFPMNSLQISASFGDAIFMAVNGDLGENFDRSKIKLNVDVNNPELTVYCEIREEFAFIHAGQKKGAGGMPVGSNGRGMLLLSGGIDSPVAGYMMAKRGLSISAVHFESFPYTSERALEKVLSLTDIISEYCGEIYVNVVSLTEIQEAIKNNCEESYFTLLLRRSMMRIASSLAKNYRCGCLITGESLGQVASQTLEALTVTSDAATVPVMRPCIGMDKEEIVQISKKIEAFETSIEPYEDCCTVFTPRHPTTRPDLAKVIAEENRYNWQELEKKAIENCRTRYPDGHLTERKESF